MPNPELEQLETSVATTVRRAYELGWTDALRKVVEELNARAPGGERIELEPVAATAVPEAVETVAPEVIEVPPPVAAPAPEPPPEAEPESQFKPMVRPPKPWWARLRG